MKRTHFAAAFTACLLAGAMAALPCAAELQRQGGMVAISEEPAGNTPAAGGLALSETAVPNAALRDALAEYDSDASGALEPEELRWITSIWLEDAGAEPLDGIEYLTELEALYCPEAAFARLDLSMLGELESVMLYDGALEELVLPASAEWVNVSGNKLTALDVSGCTELESLDVSGNRLTELDLAGCAELEQLSCGGNKLTALDVSGCPEIKNLNVYGNALTELDVSGCAELEMLDASDNKLTAVRVAGLRELEMLSLEENALTELDVSGCESLEDLYCSSNKLAALDVSSCGELVWLSCYDNKIPSLDVSRCGKLKRSSLLADDDCKVHYSGLLGLDWPLAWSAARMLLAAVAVAGALVWLVRRRRAK